MNAFINLRLTLLILVAGAMVAGVIVPEPTRAAGPWYVAPNGNDGNDCLSSSTACASINGVLSKLGFEAGDTIMVAAGIYTGAGAEVVLLNKNATLSGGWDASFIVQNGASIIDGQGARQGMLVSNDVVAIVDRLNIRNSSSDLGGGIYNRGTLTLTNSIISNNESGTEGGGIRNYGNMTLSNGSVKNNTAYDGGGIFNAGFLTVIRSSINSNTAHYDGGGVYTCGHALTLNNTTISGNTAPNSDGLHGRGGGIFSYCGALILNNSTVAYNAAKHVSGIYSDMGTSITLQNTILTGNPVHEPDVDLGCWGSGISAGYNIIGKVYGTLQPSTSDLINVDANLGLLDGSSGYHPVPFFSPAVNGGNPLGCTDQSGNPLLTDQRGLPRVGRCDIGAYEYQGFATKLYLSCLLRDFCQPWYTDDFSDAASGWPIDDDGTIRYEYLNGEYRILVRNTGWWAGARASFQAADYIVVADVRNSTGVDATYGLIFGLSSDWSQFYTLEIDASGHYYITRYSADNWILLASGSSGRLNTGTSLNRLKVERSGALISAYANGQILASITDAADAGPRRTGLMVRARNQPDVDVRFDNFSLYPVSCGVGASKVSFDVERPNVGQPEVRHLLLPSSWRQR